MDKLSTKKGTNDDDDDALTSNWVTFEAVGVVEGRSSLDYLTKKW